MEVTEKTKEPPQEAVRQAWALIRTSQNRTHRLMLLLACLLGWSWERIAALEESDFDESRYKRRLGGICVPALLYEELRELLPDLWSRRERNRGHALKWLRELSHRAGLRGVTWKALARLSGEQRAALLRLYMSESLALETDTWDLPQENQHGR